MAVIERTFNRMNANWRWRFVLIYFSLIAFTMIRCKFVRSLFMNEASPAELEFYFLNLIYKHFEDKFLFRGISRSPEIFVGTCELFKQLDATISHKNFLQTQFRGIPLNSSDSRCSTFLWVIVKCKLRSFLDSAKCMNLHKFTNILSTFLKGISERWNVLVIVNFFLCCKICCFLN